MAQEKLEQMLNDLAAATEESVRPGLAENIKQQTAQRLSPHRGGMDHINIIIDLRVNKLAAAAIIVVALLLFANFFGQGFWGGEGMLQNGKLMMQYMLGAGMGQKDTEMWKARYQQLASQGIEVYYYGDMPQKADSNSILMHWKIGEGKYKVLFRNLSEREVDSQELIQLQAQMLQHIRK